MSVAANEAVVSDEAVAAAEFSWEGGRLERGIGLALSGGGFRAMLFHAGALQRLNELGLLARVDRVASVSGGSITAGLLGYKWRTLRRDPEGRFEHFFGEIVHPLYAFSRRSIDVRDAIAGLLPFTSAAKQVAASYDGALFLGATLAALPDSPRFVFCATNLQTGALWRFSKRYSGDYVLGFVTPKRQAIRLAEAVAASSAFPPILSPLRLELDPGAFEDWPERGVHDHGRAEVAALRAAVLLTDGGVYDNHGLEPIVKRYTTLLVSDGGAPFARKPRVPGDWVRHLRRILDLTDNQVRALRRRDLIARFAAGRQAFEAGRFAQDPLLPYERLGAYWGIDTRPPPASGPGDLPCDPVRVKALAAIPTRLADLGETASKSLVNWGYLICDRCVRKHLKGQELAEDEVPRWPFEDTPLG
ncbi:patatin-like phospholipase family protein [Methylobacterium isbiliense]|uniref:PNPLA domain-containing protein n=1 Tax=Methylobacterium isbiliense TaxID=315478 RepID=A0ABQ4SIN8_9HYPH|nr:patatin-like phospholipase family protein [Methylobacterium isbiliense]MDN3624473.1 patatin-like phospholipase family protein [Methylobacterium isbiliense]GJE01644.1 hypothetical protein GMJLKIPL_3578 [Methylobacterium isbiliense]